VTISDRSLADIESACQERLFEILEMYGVGHSGGSLSILQALVALYWDIAKIDPQRPDWPERDRIILSKAHAVEAMYAVLSERGFFDADRLGEYLKFDSFLQGHTERSTPGIEYSGGSLGQGLGFAAASAYAGRLRGQSYKVFAILGDGECHEGSVWESAMFGTTQQLSNLYAIVDYNHYADHDDVDTLARLKPFDEKWRSFGWETVFVENGNDIKEITTAINNLNSPDKPKAVILNTVKNFGVPLWEQGHYHMVAGPPLTEGLAQIRGEAHAE
jgi:transketolase